MASAMEAHLTRLPPAHVSQRGKRRLAAPIRPITDQSAGHHV